MKFIWTINAFEEIARGYGDLLSAECDLSEHIGTFTEQFRQAIRLPAHKETEH